MIQFPERLELIARISQIRRECAREGWDGYEALPVTDDSVTWAVEFLNMLGGLPEIAGLPKIDVTEQRDGTIGFAWYFGGSREVAASKDGAGWILTAFSPNKIFFSERRLGVEWMRGRLPEILNEMLNGGL